MTTGTKVLCVAPVPKKYRKFMQPVPKVGWVYLVEKAMTLDDPDGNPSNAIKIAGIKNVKNSEGVTLYLSTTHFVAIDTLKAANQLRKQKYP